MEVKIIGLEDFCKFSDTQIGTAEEIKENISYNDLYGCIPTPKVLNLVSHCRHVIESNENVAPHSLQNIHLGWSGEPFWNSIETASTICEHFNYPGHNEYSNLTSQHVSLSSLNETANIRNTDNTIRINTEIKLPIKSHTETHIHLTKKKFPTEKQHSIELDRYESNRQEFEIWRGWMSSRSYPNLLLYGLGSKLDLLNAFTNKCLRETFPMVAVFCGLHPEANLRRFLTTVYKELRQSLTTGKSSKVVIPKQISDLETIIFDCVEELASILYNLKKRNKESKPTNIQELQNYNTISPPPILCIVIHNIDAYCLRNYQHHLVNMASHPLIQFVVSTDHIRYPLLWTSSQIASFRFLHLHVPTCQDYSREIKYGWGSSFPPWLIQIGKIKAIPYEAAKNALSAMPPKHKELYYEIVKMIFKIFQPNDSSSSNDDISTQEISRSILFERSRQQMIYADIQKFNAAIGEFIDHQLLFETGRKNIYQVPLEMKCLSRLFPKVVECIAADDDDDDDD